MKEGDLKLVCHCRFVLDTCRRLKEKKSYLMWTAVGCLGVAALSDLVKEVLLNNQIFIYDNFLDMRTLAFQIRYSFLFFFFFYSKLKNIVDLKGYHIVNTIV